MSDDLVTLAERVLGPRWREKLAIRRTMFDKQLALHDDPADFKATSTGRRGGKSDGIPKSCLLDVLDAGPNEVVLLGADSLKKAKALHWGNLAAAIVAHKLPLKPNMADAYWSTPWGSRVQFWGITDAMSVELIRGQKLRSARFDEVATYAALLQRLVRDVLEPALGDTGGSCTLYGTPSYTRAGNWYEICEGSERDKWSFHRWDARDNPFFRATRGGALPFFEQVIKRNGWTWETAAFQREYLGRFVDDSDMMVVEYNRDRHVVEFMPDGYREGNWPHVVGIDFGYNDAFAIVVLTMSPFAPEARFFVHAEKHVKADFDRCAEVLERVILRFRPRSVVCDPAGGGLSFYQTFNNKYGARLGVAVRSAHKVAGSLVESIRFQNTELRQGRLKVLHPAAKALTDEWQVLPWEDDMRQAPHEEYQQDAFDGGRYALMETIAWAPKAVPDEPKAEDKAEEEIRKAIESKQRQAKQLGGRFGKRW